MSAFICARCDGFRDADDGCKEIADGFRLICSDCMDAEEEEDELDSPATRTSSA